ncbi:MAG TPA: CRISPR-associated primase-polymerase type A1 [Candidatus Cloacimonas sp.]|nr:hypothetical protein [Candidatus Cloacimonas sp.]MDD2250288.1 CRISPR-associated primase-polymerase type A1 [Candidatus Cloacimonadota bacterium]MCK9157572.1 CRISPR-associated primase-polymerase type A1 [Candidatus Cloacimonas sp.]MCK9165502.1 CRISPR-associated primase-polymerase type A1 [Candidatus Cloacimonas sp.]MDD3734355.1 CRISPR-associated primase-polymerase type A1 [Candidatus Cloacimonadota bacterium]
MMQEKVTELGSQAILLPENEFHSFRLQFNSLFIKEELNTAHNLALKTLSSENLNSDELVELARCFQLLGDKDNTLTCLEKAIQIDDQNKKAKVLKLELLDSLEQKGQYLDFLQHCLHNDPQEKQYYLLLHTFYTENGQNELAENVSALALSNGINLVLPNVEIEITGDDFPPDPVAIEDPILLSNYLTLFAGRENCYARQWVSDKGKTGYTPVIEPLNPVLIRNHLQGIQTLGVYQLTLKNQVKWIVFDIDIINDYLDDIHDPHFREWVDNGFLQVLNNFDNILQTFQLRAVYEYSGYKGYHIWLFLQEYTSAAIARTFALKLATQIDISSFPFQIEVFPKQTRTSTNNFGNLIKLPGGVHRFSGLKSTFFTLTDGALEPLPLSSLLKKPPLISPSDFLSALCSLQPDFSCNTLDSSRENYQTENVNISIIPAEPSPELDPQWLWLKQRCSALAFICQKIEAHHQLNDAQKKVLIHCVGHLDRGPEIVNFYLRQCNPCDPSDFLKSTLKGNVISCNKIRSYLASENDSFDCDCDFSGKIFSYEHPLIHLEDYVLSSSPFSGNNELLLKDTISRYLDIKRRNNELSETLQHLEKHILELFEQIGVSEFKTPYGVLKKDNTDNNVKLILELV